VRDYAIRRLHAGRHEECRPVERVLPENFLAYHVDDTRPEPLDA
jgi:hypothetical protein